MTKTNKRGRITGQPVTDKTHERLQYKLRVTVDKIRGVNKSQWIGLNCIGNSMHTAFKKNQEKLQQAFGLVTDTDADKLINESPEIVAKET